MTVESYSYYNIHICSAIAMLKLKKGPTDVVKNSSHNSNKSSSAFIHIKSSRGHLITVFSALSNVQTLFCVGQLWLLLRVGVSFQFSPLLKYSFVQLSGHNTCLTAIDLCIQFSVWF